MSKHFNTRGVAMMDMFASPYTDWGLDRRQRVRGGTQSGRWRGGQGGGGDDSDETGQACES